MNPERWEKLWCAAAKEIPPQKYFDQLVAMYSEPHRRYHNQHHIADCLIEFDRAKTSAVNPMAVELAIWFHDAVYDPRAVDNEERSAELATLWLNKFNADTALTDAVGRLVLTTKHHDGSTHGDAPLLVDVDLSILGQSPERFWTYEQQIREEYAWVDKSVFTSKRAEILERFLTRERIYQTDFFCQRLEAQARENLSASVKRLSNGPRD